MTFIENERICLQTVRQKGWITGAWHLWNALQSTAAVSGKQWWKAINCLRLEVYSGGPQLSFGRPGTFQTLTKLKTKAWWEWTFWCFPNALHYWLFSLLKAFLSFSSYLYCSCNSQSSLVDPRCLHKVFQKLKGDWVNSRTQQCLAAGTRQQRRGKKPFCFYFNCSLKPNPSCSYDICIVSQQLKGCSQFKKCIFSMHLVFRAEQGELCTSAPDKGKGLACLPGGGWDRYETACVCMPLLQIFSLTKVSSHPDLELSKSWERCLGDCAVSHGFRWKPTLG